MGKSLSKSRFIELFGDIKEKNKWPREKWSDVCEIINGKDFKSVEDPNGQYAVYGTGGFMAKANQYTCPENSIIIGRKGTINKPLLVKEKFWNIDTAFGVVPNITKVHYQYFYWFCKQFNFMSINKGTTLPSTTKTDLQKIEINVPPLELQLHFSHLVDQIDKSKFILQKMIEKLELLKKSRFIELFGDLNTNPFGFEVKKLSEIAEYYNGVTYKPENIVDSKSGFLVLRSSNIQNGQIAFDDNVYINMNIKDKHKVEDNDILMCSRNGSAKLVGKVALIHDCPKDTCFGAFMMIIRSKFFNYLYSYFQSTYFRQRLVVGATSTINQITVSMLDNIKLPIPPIELVNKYTEQVKQIDKSKLILQKQLEDLVGETK
ncbi:MAG: restriction endonuclease subunit S [Succinivibrio sp.]|nr:restriction endonuclease subunit S [Succinivibrio sp.]